MIAYRLLLACGLAVPMAQSVRAQDTLRLGVLQAAAVARDPRSTQHELARASSALRVTSLEMERRPQLSLSGSASHQSDVTFVPLTLAGTSLAIPPRDRWQATLDLQQLLYDGGAIAARALLERSRLAETAAAVDAALYRITAEVNGAFFTAFLLQERVREFEALRVDLDARLQLARARVTNGAALSRDTLAIVAEQLRAELSRDEASSARRASLAILTRLTGIATRESAVLLLPDLATAVSQASEGGDPESLRDRPEFAQFDRMRDRLGREAALARTENRPRLLAFGQAGLGRPGLNQFRTSPDEFWQAGLRVEWRPWTWRSAERSTRALELQARVVTTEERALAEQLARAVEGDRADIERLTRALAADARLVTLRHEIERQAQLQFAEGVITAADYIEMRTDVLEATLTLARHRAEQSQAEARYLTTLGLAPRTIQSQTP